MNEITLSPDEKLRYNRQMIIDGWGETGQLRLSSAHVGIAGVGGLGAPVALYLAAAGIGELTLCDNEQIDLTNLNRQVLYDSREVGESKVATAARKLHHLNPGIILKQRHETICDDSIATIFPRCNLIIDCLDNFETRLVLNRFSLAQQIPLLHGGVREYFGELLFLQPPDTACLRCCYPKDVIQPMPVPVCGAVAGVLGSMQALMAIRYLLGDQKLVAGKMIQVDLVSMSTDAVAVDKRMGCCECDL
jgi:molybdopterin-synthase adenylyltransferase